MIGNVPLIKERDGQPGRLVGQGDFGQIETLADVGRAGVGDDNGLEAGGLVYFQIGDGPQPRPILVAPGEIGNEIVEGADVQFGQLLGPCGTDAGENRDRVEERSHTTPPEKPIWYSISPFPRGSKEKEKVLRRNRRTLQARCSR